MTLWLSAEWFLRVMTSRISLGVLGSLLGKKEIYHRVPIRACYTSFLFVWQTPASAGHGISGNKHKLLCVCFFLLAYKVEIIAVAEENAFVKYTATLLDIFKAGKNSFTSSFIQQIFSPYYVAGIILDTKDITWITQSEFLPS